MHLHAQELANYEGPRGVELEKAEEPPPVVPFGTGPTMYGEMCEPPREAPVAWEDRRFQDAESLIRQAYIERYARVLDDEAHGNLDEPENTMIPKVKFVHERGGYGDTTCVFPIDTVHTTAKMHVQGSVGLNIVRFRSHGVAKPIGCFVTSSTNLACSRHPLMFAAAIWYLLTISSRSLPTSASYPSNTDSLFIYDDSHDLFAPY